MVITELDTDQLSALQRDLLGRALVAGRQSPIGPSLLWNPIGVVLTLKRS
jgi:hypothetical protein